MDTCRRRRLSLTPPWYHIMVVVAHAERLVLLLPPLEVELVRGAFLAVVMMLVRWTRVEHVARLVYHRVVVRTTTTTTDDLGVLLVVVPAGGLHVVLLRGGGDVAVEEAVVRQDAVDGGVGRIWIN